MESVDVGRIAIAPFEFEGILQMRIEKSLNEHSTLYVYGVIKDEKQITPVTGATEGAIIKCENNGQLYFCGLLMSIKITCIDDVRYLEISAISNTISAAKMKAINAVKQSAAENNEKKQEKEKIETGKKGATEGVLTIGETNVYDADKNEDGFDEQETDCVMENADEKSNNKSAPTDDNNDKNAKISKSVRVIFDEFDNLTCGAIDEIWLKNKAQRKKYLAAFRYPGGYHEWFMVSKANVFKRWGVTSEDMHNFRSETGISFNDVYGISGAHTGSSAGRRAHMHMAKIIDSCDSAAEYSIHLASKCMTKAKSVYCARIKDDNEDLKVSPLCFGAWMSVHVKPNSDIINKFKNAIFEKNTNDVCEKCNKDCDRSKSG